MRQDTARLTMLVCLGAICFLSACAGPRVVTQATSRGDQIKMVYYQKKFLNAEQGIMQCKIAEGGKLTDCRKLPVKFTETGVTW